MSETPSPSIGPLGKAGLKLARYLSTEQGEEVMEGTIGGLLVGLPTFFDPDTDKRQAALQTALAIGGGIGLGMAGRRIGAHLGKQMHPDEIKHEGLAQIFRFAGQERMTDGAAIAARELSARAGLERLEHQINQMKFDLATLDDEAFKAAYPAAHAAGIKPSAAKQDTEVLLNNLTSVNQEIFGRARQLEKERGEQAAAAMGDMRSKLDEIDPADLPPELADQLGDAKDVTGRLKDMVDTYNADQQPVTGEHAGRAIGRFIGDEVGILGGLGLGGMLAAGLGIQSPKDREIARLQEELASAGR
jgi:hypothetical protein